MVSYRRRRKKNVQKYCNLVWYRSLRFKVERIKEREKVNRALFCKRENVCACARFSFKQRAWNVFQWKFTLLFSSMRVLSQIVTYGCLYSTYQCYWNRSMCAEYRLHTQQISIRKKENSLTVCSYRNTGFTAKECASSTLHTQFGGEPSKERIQLLENSMQIKLDKYTQLDEWKIDDFHEFNSQFKSFHIFLFCLLHPRSSAPLPFGKTENKWVNRVDSLISS